MKKLMVVLMGLLFSASAFAQDAQGPQFKYSVWANAFAVTETTAKKDEYKDYSNIRVRPMFTLTNENVSVVTRLEIDQYFGGNNNTKTFETDPGGDDVEVDFGKNGNSYAGKGTDNYAVEVKNIYIDVKDMFMPGLSMRAGLAGFRYPIMFNEDAAIFNFSFVAGMAKIDLTYGKVWEGSTTEKKADGVDNKDDQQFYSAKAAIKAGDITITPAMLYAVGEEDSAREYALMMPALSLGMKQGTLSVNADFVYVTGDYDKANKVDASAYAAFLNVGYKVSDALLVNVFGLYTTGENDKADERTSFKTASTLDKVRVGTMFIMNDGGNITQVGISNEFDEATEGIMMFGLSASMKMDKLTVLGQIAYATTTSDKVVKDTAIGTELNLRLAYEVAPKTSVWAEGAYLAAGDYVKAVQTGASLGKNDNPMYYALGVMTSF